MIRSPVTGDIEFTLDWPGRHVELYGAVLASFGVVNCTEIIEYMECERLISILERCIS